MDDREESVTLDPHQKELEKALLEVDERAASIYLGAVLVSKQKSNPDRISLCAHGLRELITLLPKFIDLPIVKEARQQLGHFADALMGDWQAMQNQKKWPGDPPWNGLIDDALRKILVRTASLVEGHISIREGRKIQVREIIKKQNFSAVPLPPNIEELKAKEWESYRSYFAKTAHHTSTNETDFLSWVTHFEYLLLNYLKPRTFENNAELLKVISEVQNDR